MPIVLVAIWGVFLTLAHVRRSQLLRELSACVAHGKEKDATAALRQLVRMPNPPLETFVTAATSPSREVARQAQSSLTELLRKWQRQLHGNKNAAQIGARLEVLATTLDANRDSFSTVDCLWLTRTTEEIVRLANAVPLDNAPTLAMHCESLFALTSVHAATTSGDVVPIASTALDGTPANLFSPPSRLALQSLVREEEFTESEVLEVDAPLNTESAIPDLPLNRSKPGSHDSSQNSSPRSFDLRHRADIAEASPVPAGISRSMTREAAETWATVDSRVLLERWLSTSGKHNFEVERELRRRGFGGLRADVVHLALSGDTARRILLVHDLLDTPGVGAKAWLILFADDADAEIRLLAVSMMATSRDPELLEKAWQVALRDRDLRISELAVRLRDRRDTTGRH